MGQRRLVLEESLVLQLNTPGTEYSRLFAFYPTYARINT
jgi:hypothetical protein